MLARVLLALVAALNLVPTIVTAVPTRAAALYGLDAGVLEDPVARLLLRHRGVLFALVSAWLGASVWMPELRPWAMLSALVAKSAFLLLYWSEPRARTPLRLVAQADVLAIAALLVAWAL